MSRFSALGHQAITESLAAVLPPCITGHLPALLVTFSLMSFSLSACVE
jgi:hypothetical protein